MDEKIMNPKFFKKKTAFIIAEAGVNHNGDMVLAKRLIDVAKEAGADAVKFQTFKTVLVVSMKAAKSPYQKKYTHKKESLYQMLSRLELKEKQFTELNMYARRKRILFLSTPTDKESVDLLVRLGVPAIKVASSDITNLPLLEYIAKQKRPVILSKGRSTLQEVKEAFTVIGRHHNRVALLHCVSNYPADYKDLNLQAIPTLKTVFKVPVGFSDHTLGWEAAVAAVALGAQIIEKHFTLDRHAQGPDHRTSLEPAELRKFVSVIRSIESALGNGQKVPAATEYWGRKNVRKGLVSNIDIPKGAKIDENMIGIKRPGLGIAPRDFEKVIGKTALKTIRKDQPIYWRYIN